MSNINETWHEFKKIIIEQANQTVGYKTGVEIKKAVDN